MNKILFTELYGSIIGVIITAFIGVSIWISCQLILNQFKSKHKQYSMLVIALILALIANYLSYQSPQSFLIFLAIVSWRGIKKYYIRSQQT
jgi:hypothetical protein